MTTHTKYALRSSCVSEVLDLALAISAPEAGCAECLVAGEDGEVFDLVPARAAAVCAVITDE